MLDKNTCVPVNDIESHGACKKTIGSLEFASRLTFVIRIVIIAKSVIVSINVIQNHNF